MALSSTSTSSTTSSLLGQSVSEKLTRDNFLFWKAQILPPLRGAQLDRLLDGSRAAPTKTIDVEAADKSIKKVDNPEYALWVAQDQQVLGYLLNSLSKDVLIQVLEAKTAAQAWAAITSLFSAHSKAWVTNLKMLLSTTRKGGMTAAAYYAKMKTIRDELVATGNGPDDEEFISFVLNGLNFDYNSLVSSILGRIGTITINDFYAELLSFEMRLAMLKETPDGEGQFQSSVNAASRGRGGGYRGGRGLPNRGRTTGGRGPGGRGPGGRTGGGKKKESCQICGKGGHEALRCWYRWDESYQAEDEKSANAVASYGVDTNWYTDSGATDHVTSELEKLTTRDKYHGQDKVPTASGSGMIISHVGNASIHTPMHNRDLILKDVLCVPSAHKNLVSVHRLAKDNKAFLEFHPSFFLIKDQVSKRVILHGRCEGGLYPLPAPNIKAHDKLILGVQRPSSEVWHSRLGHPAFPIVRHIVKSRNLPCLAESKSQSVCDSCQRAKSHQLPYGVSTSVSTVPFELVFSDVWGPAPTSVGRHEYYVSFIDDFSKYVWIYLLKKKSDVYQVFLNFQNFVERQFQCKIKTMQTD